MPGARYSVSLVRLPSDGDRVGRPAAPLPCGARACAGLHRAPGWRGRVSGAGFSPEPGLARWIDGPSLPDTCSIASGYGRVTWRPKNTPPALSLGAKDSPPSRGLQPVRAGVTDGLAAVPSPVAAAGSILNGLPGPTGWGGRCCLGVLDKGPNPRTRRAGALQRPGPMSPRWSSVCGRKPLQARS